MVTFDLEVEDLKLSINKTVECGLIINELVTNALKHAFPKGREGLIKIIPKKTGR